MNDYIFTTNKPAKNVNLPYPFKTRGCSASMQPKPATAVSLLFMLLLLGQAFTGHLNQIPGEERAAELDSPSIVMSSNNTTDTDGDGIYDTNDACPNGTTNWTSSYMTDHDGDGCKDNSTEDMDDDNDGLVDAYDSCMLGNLGWISSNTTDYDSDGCQDSSEDLDDDNDGVLDLDDSCMLGDLGWFSSNTTDADGDGCRDATEDTDGGTGGGNSATGCGNDASYTSLYAYSYSSYYYVNDTFTGIMSVQCGLVNMTMTLDYSILDSSNSTFDSGNMSWIGSNSNYTNEIWNTTLTQSGTFGFYTVLGYYDANQTWTQLDTDYDTFTVWNQTNGSGNSSGTMEWIGVMFFDANDASLGTVITGTPYPNFNSTDDVGIWISTNGLNTTSPSPLYNVDFTLTHLLPNTGTSYTSSVSDYYGDVPGDGPRIMNSTNTSQSFSHLSFLEFYDGCWKLDAELFDNTGLLLATNYGTMFTIGGNNSCDSNGGNTGGNNTDGNNTDGNNTGGNNTGGNNTGGNNTGGNNTGGNNTGNNTGCGYNSTNLTHTQSVSGQPFIQTGVYTTNSVIFLNDYLACTVIGESYQLDVTLIRNGSTLVNDWLHNWTESNTYEMFKPWGSHPIGSYCVNSTLYTTDGSAIPQPLTQLSNLESCFVVIATGNGGGNNNGGNNTGGNNTGGNNTGGNNTGNSSGGNTPGMNVSNPVMPTNCSELNAMLANLTNLNNQWNLSDCENGTGFWFDVVVNGTGVTWFDPIYAVGYEFEVISGPNFASVNVPNGTGDDIYEVYLWNGTDYQLVATNLQAGQEYWFTGSLSGNALTYSPSPNYTGVERFAIGGLEISAQLDPTDPNGFVTGLSFIIPNGNSSQVVMSMTPVTASDMDDDGFEDSEDNCWNMSNTDQLDTDGDNLGDLCDLDDDNDGLDDSNDVFPLDPSEQMDSDNDGIGNNLDSDDDGDGVTDSIDNCPLTPNSDQADLDGDGIGSECDDMEVTTGGNGTIDSDGDSIPSIGMVGTVVAISAGFLISIRREDEE